MAVIESPNDPRIIMEVDPSFAAARVSARPLEFKAKSGELVGGHYRTGFFTGSTTILAAGDAIVSMRWNSDQLLFVLQRLRAFATVITAFTTGQELALDLVKMNGFTASDTGGTDKLPAIQAGAGRKRLTMQPSRITDLGVANATALGAGTGTADGQACGYCNIPCYNVVGSSAGEDLIQSPTGGEHPLALAKQEGFRIRIAQVQGAVGVVRYSFVMDWAEVPSY